jgi:PAS domain S-box-containing protein
VDRPDQHPQSDETAQTRSLASDEARWHTYLEQADDLIFTLDPQGRITWANQMACQVLGYALDQLLGASPLEFLAADSRALAAASLAKIWHGESVRQLELQVLTRAGRAVTLELRGRALYHDGRLVETLHIARDITERKRIESIEREQRALVEALHDTAAALNSTLDLDQVLDRILANLGRVMPHDACSIWMVDERTGLARVARSRGHAERDSDGTIDRLVASVMDTANLRRMAETGRPLVIPDTSADPGWVEFPVMRWIRSYAGAPIRVKGQVVGFINLDSATPGFFESAHAERLRAFADQAALAIENARLYQKSRHEHGQLQALIEASRDGIVLIGLDRRLLVINAHALHLLRLPGQPDDWRGRTMRDVLRHMQDLPQVVRLILDEMRCIRRGDEPPGEGQVEIPPHTFHWVNLPVCVADAPLGRLIVYRDVTEERAVERLREDMTHMMVHDLRNPLELIAGSLELIGGAPGELAPDVAEAVRIARSGSRKLIELVNRILDVARLERGHAALDWAPFALSELCAEVVQLHASAAGAKGLQITCQLGPALPLAYGDAGLIRRVLQNLVGNAVKFTPSGGAVSVVAQAAPAQNAQVWVSVSDTGLGIPDDVQRRLFQKFARGRHAGHGSGLGLAFCKLAVEAHGQRIWAERVPGRGATFTFSLSTANSETV